jgi:hypothetical protein
MEEILQSFKKQITHLSFEAIILFVSSTIFGAFIKSLWQFWTKQEIHEDIHKSQQVRIILQRLSANRAILDASRILVTRIHNGSNWFNKKHMHKLSIYRLFNIEDFRRYTKHRMLDTELRGILLSEISDILVGLHKKDFDILSVSEIPKDVAILKTLIQDKVNYILLIKIHSRKQSLGYIWVLFADEKKDFNFDKETIDDFVKISAEIGEYFK